MSRVRPACVGHQHEPFVQRSPGAQTLPHAPQLVGSIDVFTQAVVPSNGHDMVPDGQVKPASKGGPASMGRPASKGAPVHLPLVHSCPKAQTVPHAPQLVGSTDVFTQAVVPSNGHDVVPVGHVKPASMGVPVHLPLEQSCPKAQTVPHAPQLVGSIDVLVQMVVPSNGHAVVLGGHVKPASRGGPASMGVPVQLPLVQNCPRAHAVPHAPQWVGSIAVFVHTVTPLDTHAVVPGGHVKPASTGVPAQLPLMQSCPNAHALPHAPQLLGSNSVLTQAVNPSTAHCMVPAGQVNAASGGSVSCDIDCPPRVPSFSEHAGRTIVPKIEPMANVAAHQREARIDEVMVCPPCGRRAGVMPSPPYGLPVPAPCRAPHEMGHDERFGYARGILRGPRTDGLASAER
jgi:hypothetical protein